MGKRKIVVVGNGMVGHHFVNSMMEAGAEDAITVRETEDNLAKIARVLEEYDRFEAERRTARQRAVLIVQAAVLGLALVLLGRILDWLVAVRFPAAPRLPQPIPEHSMSSQRHEYQPRSATTVTSPHVPLSAVESDT